MLTCAVCRVNESTQEHHLSYHPEIKIDICNECHEFLHGHNVGLARQTSRNLLFELREQGKNFITSDELRGFCEKYDFNYESVIRHLLPRGWMIRVFRGVFYILSLEEKNKGVLNSSMLELVANGLFYKKVDNWYVGLKSALWKNGVISEPEECYIINDTIQRRGMFIGGKTFNFKKLRANIINFGIVNGVIPFSDLEKTLLDMIYLGRYNGKPSVAIWVTEVKKHWHLINKEKMIAYSKHYPKTVQEFVMSRV